MKTKVEPSRQEMIDRLTMIADMITKSEDGADYPNASNFLNEIRTIAVHGRNRK